MRDNKDEVICPACGKVMTKIKAPNNDFYIDICLDGCGGIYFDNQELKRFDEKHENVDFIIEAIKGKTFEKVDTEAQRICPYCSTPMAKNYSDASCEIEVDSCYTCGAVFLDCDELFRIREQFDNESERVDDFNKKFMAAYAQDILKAKEEADKAAQSRSLLRKLFLSGYEKYRDLSR